jgi:hypothetical protein
MTEDARPPESSAPETPAPRDTSPSESPEPASSEASSSESAESPDQRGDFLGGVEMPPRFKFSPYQMHYNRVNRRRDRIVDEIARNRRGEQAVPTWVLAVILLALIAGFAAVVIFS